MAFFSRLLNFRVPANLLFVTAVCAGAFSLFSMPVEEFPNVAFDQIEVRTTFPGASAEEVERLVTKVIEDEIEDVRGIEWIRSTSGPDFSRILVKMLDDLPSYETVLRDLESEVRRAVRDLPPGAEVPIVEKIEVESLNPVVQVILGGSVDEAVLRAGAEELERRLEELPGVRGVNVFGRRDRELHIDVDPVALESLDLTLPEVADALALRNVNVPSGQLESGGASVSVRALGEWQSTEEVLDTPVRSAQQGGVVLLREIATVTESYEDALIRARFRGRPSIALAIIKEGRGNALTVRRLVEDVCTAFERERMAEGLELDLIADTTIRIRSRISALAQNIGLGAVFVVILLTLSIGVRMSILAIWGVAFSFLGAFIVLRLFGQSINTLSLFGLVLVSGLLVDDAIVVLENIVRHRDLGTDLRTACIRGTSEVAWPVTASVLTSVAAFLPLLLMTGITGKFFAVIPIAVCAALAASLFEAIFLMPIHAYELGLGKGRGARAAAHGGPPRQTVWARGVAALVRLTTRHRYLTLALLFVVGAATLVAAGRLRTVFFPSEYQMFFVNVRLDPGASLDETTDILDLLDAEMRRFPPDVIESSFGTAGFYYDFNYQPHVGATYGQLLVTVADVSVRSAPLTEVMDEARARLGRLELGAARIEVTELNDGPPIGRPVTLRVQCEDLERLKEASLAIEAIVGGMPGAKDVLSGLELGRNEIFARLDDEVAALRGASAAAVGRTLAAANQGLIATQFRGIDEDWDVRVRLVEGARRTLADLSSARVRTSLGARVPLSEVAVIAERPAYSSIERFQRERTVTVTADVDTARTSSLEINRALQEKLGPFLAANPGVRILYAGEFEETQRSFDSLAQAFVVALLVMYMILGTQFASYLQPFVVLAAVPFALVGVVGGLHLTGDPLTVPVLLGVVGLAGVAVNDSIVLISFANDLVRGGKAPLEAAREATGLRLRALVLTTVTTIAGLLPSAVGLGVGGRSVVWGPMATAFAFGIASATCFTILVTPALWLIAHDIQRLFRGRASGPSATSTDGR